MTLAPAEARRWTAARPMPRLPPVTRTRLFSRPSEIMPRKLPYLCVSKVAGCDDGPVSTSRTDGRRTDTRERIRATALELFVRQGYELTTLAQVAHRLEITRPAVYYHFRSKEEVLTSSYQEVTSLLDAIISGDRAATLDRTIELFSG